MANQKKVIALEKLTEKVKKAKGLVLTDYSGLNVAQITELRKAIKQSGGEFEVAKNNLLSLATKKSQFSDLQLEGPTAALWIYNDDPSPIKALDQFIKTANLPKINKVFLRIKFGFWDGHQISPQTIQELANIPGLKELRAKLVGALQFPRFGLVNSLGWNLRRLVFILIRQLAEKGGLPPTVALRSEYSGSKTLAKGGESHAN